MLDFLEQCHGNKFGLFVIVIHILCPVNGPLMAVRQKQLKTAKKQKKQQKTQKGSKTQVDCATLSCT